LGRFLNSLTDKQQDAIATFKIGDSEESVISEEMSLKHSKIRAMRQGLRKRMRSRGGTARDVFEAWSGLAELSRMRGLERLVVGNHYFAQLQETENIGRETVTEKLRSYIGDRSVDIIFEAEPTIQAAERTIRMLL